MLSYVRDAEGTLKANRCMRFGLICNASLQDRRRKSGLECDDFLHEVTEKILRRRKKFQFLAESGSRTNECQQTQTYFTGVSRVMPLFLLLRKLKLLAVKIISLVNMLHSVADVRSVATPEMKLSELHLSVLSNNTMT
jgi:hypothetical protein